MTTFNLIMALLYTAILFFFIGMVVADRTRKK